MSARRGKKRKLALSRAARLRQLNDAANAIAYWKRCVDSAREDARKTSAENSALHDQIERFRNLIRRICGGSILNEPDMHIPPHVRRVPVSTEFNYILERLTTSDHFSAAAQIEELTHIVMGSRDLRNECRKMLHFRVINPPGQPDFQTAYAISHAAVELCRHTDVMAKAIAREITAHVAKRLFSQ